MSSLKDLEYLEVLTRGGRLQEILDALCRACETNAANLRASILLYDGERNRLAFGAGPSLPEEFNRLCDGLPLAHGSGSCAEAFLRADTVVTADIKGDPEWEDIAPFVLEHGVRACLAHPIILDGGVVGVVGFYFSKKYKAADRDLAMIQSAARAAANAIGREMENAPSGQPQGIDQGIRQIVDCAQDAVLMVRHGLIKAANPAAISLFGAKSEEQLTGHHVTVLAKSESHDALDELAARPEGSIEKLKFVRLDATEFEGRADCRTFNTGDSVVRLVFVLHQSDQPGQADLPEQDEPGDDRFRDFAEIAADWCWEIDSELRFTYLSDGFHGATGDDPDTVLGIRLQDLSAAEDASDWSEQAQVLESHEAFQNLIFSRCRADGSFMWIAAFGKPLFDVDGTFKGYRGASRDITPEMISKRALKESEALLQQFAQASIDAFLVIQDGRIIDANQAAADLFGYEAPELVGMDPVLLVAQEHRDAAIDRISSEREGVHEATALRKDGVEFPAELSSNMLPAEEDSVRVTVIRDISVRPQSDAAEADTAETEDAQQPARDLIDAAAEQCLLIDRNLIVLAVNDAFTRHVDKPLDDIVGNPLGTVISDKSRGLHSANCNRVLEHGAPVEYETRQGDRLFANRCCPIPDSDGVVQKIALYSRGISEQQALRESEERYRSIVESSPEAIFVNKGGTILLANSAAARLFGAERAEKLLGVDARDFVHPDDHPSALLGPDEAAGEQRPELEVRERWFRLDGPEFVAGVTATPLDWDGEPAELVTVRDVTDHKTAETALRARDEWLSAAQRIPRLAFWEWDFDGACLHWSEQARVLLGLDMADSRTTFPEFLEMVPAEDHEAVRRAMHNTLKTQAPFTVQHRVVKSGGPERLVRTEAEVDFDDTGRLTYLAGVIQDITDLGIAEFAPRESGEYVRDIADNLPGMVFQQRTHPDGRIELCYVSEGVKEVTGFEAEELKSNPSLLPDIMHPHDKVAYMLAQQRSLETLEPITVDFRIDTRAGEDKWLRAKSRPSLRDDKSVIWDAILLDITDRKEAEIALAESEAQLNRHILELHATKERLETRTAQLMQTARELERSRDAAEAANRAKSEFLSTVTHEIRTPMNGVLGMAHLIRDTGLTDQQREYVETIHECGESLMAMIDDILDYSSIEAGRLTLESADYAPADVVYDVAHLLAPKALDRGLELTVAVSADVPGVVVGDAGRLRQILMNLAGNAIKFTKSGAVTIEASRHRDLDGAVAVRFEVTDTGIGISEADQACLFAPFMQADSSSTRMFGGVGLGLAISAQLCRLMDGEIRVDSRPKQGSTFTVTLPLAVDAQNSGVSAAKASLAGKRALVVGGSELSRRLISAQLEIWGLGVAMAETGEVAQRHLTAASSDGVPVEFAFIDHDMPDMDAYAFARVVRSCGELGAVRLIYASSTKIDGLAETVDGAQIEACLDKPVRSTALLEALGGGAELPPEPCDESLNEPSLEKRGVA